jgi:hypothetical protein
MVYKEGLKVKPETCVISISGCRQGFGDVRPPDASVALLGNGKVVCMTSLTLRTLLAC